jgi:hypothetical protein
MHCGEQVTDERQAFASCPNCERPVSGHTLEPHGLPYCSRECYLHDQQLRICESCSEPQDAVTFQPAPGGKPGVAVCEVCASTCRRCGVVQEAPELLDPGGGCRWCEARLLAKAAWVASPLNCAARRLLEILEDLAPEKP